MTDARWRFSATVEGGESSPEIHNNLGRIHLGRGELDEAQREFEQALALDANNADALLNMGSIQRARGRIADAEHFVKRALRVNPWFQFSKRVPRSRPET